MDACTILAAVALVVSLVALIASLTQRFGTAEGGRRCNESVLGVWHGLIRWKWRWSELRMEVLYTTPELSIQPSNAIRRLAQSAGGFPDLHPISPLEGEVPTEEVNSLSPNYRPSLDGVKDKKFADSSETQVTWILFMQQLRMLYESYNIQSLPVKKGRPQSPSWQVQRITSKPRRGLKWIQDWEFYNRVTYNAPTEEPSLRSEVAIQYRERSWDFMPSDAVRPLALTHPGPLIVMAARLGMAWWGRPAVGNDIRMSGNGFSLTSTEVRGIGMVVQFRRENVLTTTPQPTFVQLIPSEATDKMICGVLPICTDLFDTATIPEYPMVGDGIVSADYVAKFLRDFDAAPEICDVVCSHDNENRYPYLSYQFAFDLLWHRCQVNEVMILTCPFMPVKEAPQCRRIRFLGWLGKIPTATFTHHEARIIYLREILRAGEKSKNSGKDDSAASWHKRVNASLKRLESDFPDTWYGHFHGIGNHPCPRRHTRPVAHNDFKLVEVCREEFAVTTKFFTRSPAWKSLEIPYKTLVGAHLSFGWLVAEETQNLKPDEGRPEKGRSETGRSERGRWEKGKPEKDMGPLLDYANWPLPKDVPDSVGETNADAANLASSYIKRLDEFVNEVASRMGKRKESYSAEQQSMIKAAWWIMVLRGIAWSMSVEMESPNGVEVPGYMYRSQTPIWIT